MKKFQPPNIYILYISLKTISESGRNPVTVISAQISKIKYFVIYFVVLNGKSSKIQLQRDRIKHNINMAIIHKKKPYRFPVFHDLKKKTQKKRVAGTGMMRSKEIKRANFVHSLVAIPKGSIIHGVLSVSHTVRTSFSSRLVVLI